MDVSPETVRQVEFREKLRGYHQDDVDEFLERMAAGLEILQERLREATERANRAEQQARDASEGEESLRRTLVLAQRTADLAVQEANEQAARILESANAEGHAILAHAEEEARRNAREIQSQAWADIGRLEAAREQLRQDVAALERYVEEERGRAQAALAEAARQLQKLLPGPSVPPRLHDLDLSGVRTWMTAPGPAVVPGPGPVAERGREIGPEVGPGMRPEMGPEMGPDIAPDIGPDMGPDMGPVEEAGYALGDEPAHGPPEDGTMEDGTMEEGPLGHLRPVVELPGDDSEQSEFQQP